MKDIKKMQKKNFFFQDYNVFLWGRDNDTWSTFYLSRALVLFLNTLEN